LFIFLYPLLEEYIVFVRKYVTGRRVRFRPYKVFILLIRITSRVDQFIIKVRKLGLNMQILEILAQRPSWNCMSSTLRVFFQLCGIMLCSKIWLKFYFKNFKVMQTQFFPCSFKCLWVFSGPPTWPPLITKEVNLPTERTSN